ncbi:Lysine-specific demethylase REF6 [Zea mays]|uniref:Lysine-specific demethylase REF6 n=2 Tax=Zea mays TaxID=4577 RepID=A0A1D6N409_MAIZE|nr:Lysine-specific demethylase REF6 [Zea mays]ONM35397.1 Lysine-specific demethylase REF6 [Zea mays]
MLYVGMMFSWFAWHVEYHDLHSLNYMHYGAPKTWYGVPRDAALAFEDVVRVHGYGGEVNSLETFALLGDKTTVMSPEVLVDSGVPCCRQLVQNAGEFVVTFPGAYHSGFSHGFNCGEASNIATPEWLRVAKEAAVRRASINRPPMVSHYQLLYELALSLFLRDPSNGAMEPRSCRLKEKKKSEGDQFVKKIFVQNVIEDNKVLCYFLSDGSPCIILRVNYNDGSPLSTLLSKFQSTTDSRIAHDQCRSGSEMNVNSIISDAVPLNAHSALDLLASAYGDPSDSNEDVMNQKIQVPNASNELINHAIESQPITSSNGDCDGTKVSLSSKECQQGPLSQGSKCIGNSNTLNGPKGVHTRNKDLLKMVLSEGFQPKYIYSETHKKVQCEPSSSNKTSMETPCSTNYHVSHNSATICMNSKRGSTTMVNNLATSVVKPDKDSSRMHVFCLEHAIEVEKQLQAIGGADIFLLCHPVPYNRVIYEAFGYGSPSDSPVKLRTYSRRQGRTKKILLAGRWCGKVWMSNQVHPYLADRIKIHEPEETDKTFPSDQKSNAEPVEDSSREAASTRKSSSRAIEGKTSKREKESLEKANAKNPKFTEEDNSKSLEGTAEASTRKIKSRSVLEKTIKKEKEHVEKAKTKKLKHTEKVSEALKGPSEASFPAPAGMVVRSSSRIANRKSKMEEEDNGSANPPKPKAEGDKDNPAGRSRAKSPRQKTKADTKKKTKETRAEKRRAPSPASQKDEEEQAYDAEGCSITKQRLSLRKKGAKTEEKQQTEESRYRGRAPPSSPERKEEYASDIEGCSMSFGTKQALSLHKNDICPEKGCCRKFFSHKYLLQHRKVHADDRPRNARGRAAAWRSSGHGLG